MAKSEGKSSVKSLETTLRIIQFLQSHEGENLETIANHLDVGKSTVHRHLATLRRHGYVLVEEGEYRLSLKFLTHGGEARDRIPNNGIINRKVKQISEETGERVQFIVEEDGERVIMFMHTGEKAVNTNATIGKRGPLHVSAAGKAILAYLPGERREEIISSTSFEKLTDNSLEDRETLRAELEEINKKGYASNKEESTDGLHAVGAPVRFGDDRVLGAISISGPANRFSGDYFYKELPKLLLGTVNELELNLRYA